MSQTIQQQAPQMADGMRRVPFPTESYEHPSRPLSAKRLLNCFIEQQPSDARSPAALRTIPGLDYRETLGVGPVHVFDTDYVGGFYAVSGSYVFRNQNGATNNLGYVGTASDAAWLPPLLSPSIAISPNYAVICVPPRLYWIAHDTWTLTEIDTSEFQGGGCNSVAFCDGYFIGTQHSIGNRWFISSLNDPTTWDALDYNSADSIVNILSKVIVHRGEIWLLGQAGAEVWYNTGAADFPFRRQSGGVIQFGFTPRTSIVLDGSVWFLSYDGCVYRTNGYKPQRVSTHAIEAIIETATPNRAIGFGYVQEGHAFYCLTFTDLNRTLCYDAATQKWHDRSSLGAAWRPLVTSRIDEAAYAGDTSGRLYTVNPNGAYDNGALIQQSVTFPPLYANTRRAFCTRAELEMEAPPTSDVLLSWSDDGGTTFTAGRTMSGAQAPNARNRLVTTRLGSFRQRIFKIATTGRSTIYAMDVDADAGAH